MEQLLQCSAGDSFRKDNLCTVATFRPTAWRWPHHLASQSALAILREGGSAIEAMVAAAAAIAVVYPHMNGLGGDGFWLIVPPEGIASPLTPAGPPDRWRPSRPTPDSGIFPTGDRRPR
jgi:gamma-glutamyltranspeptidase/glutathione hydrolase